MKTLYFKNKRGKIVSMTQLGFDRLSKDQQKDLKPYKAPTVPKVLKDPKS